MFVAFSNKPELSFEIDDEDYLKIKEIKWNLNSHGYVVGQVNKKSVRLQRFLMSEGLLVEGVVVDHKDRNKLNNKKGNLRVTTQSVNVSNTRQCKKSKYFNVTPQINRTEGYTTWNATGSRKDVGREKHTFRTEQEAALAADYLHRKYYGEDAVRFNFPGTVWSQQDFENAKINRGSILHENRTVALIKRANRPSAYGVRWIDTNTKKVKQKYFKTYPDALNFAQTLGLPVRDTTIL